MSKSIWKRIAIVIATVAATFGLALVTVAPMNGAAANETGACVDPDGDGWGWDGAKSCLTASNPDSSSSSYGGGMGGNRYKNHRVLCEDSGHGSDYGWAALHIHGRNGQFHSHGVTCTVGKTVSFKIRQSSGRLISTSES